MYGKYRDHATPLKLEKRKTSRIVLINSSGKRALEQSRLRLFCLAVVFGLSFLAVGARLIEVGVLRGGGGSAVQTLAEYRAQKPDYPRADIVDRNGNLVATTLETASLYADPRDIRQPVHVAEVLAKILPEVDEKEIAKRLSSDRSFVWVKRHLTPKQQQAVNNLGVPGLEFEPEFKRVYPHGNLLAHVLGYVDLDTKGIAGIEKGMDEVLRNEEGSQEAVQLSIDLRIQSIMREELQKSIKDFRAVGGMGLVLDVKTGEMVSMVSLPDFDPQEPGKAKDDARFNRATLGVYEMGSTFKTFTMAMALETGTANLRSGYDATKPIRVARYTIRDFHPKNRWLTVPEIFAYSSNIGTVKMVMDVGTGRQKQFLSDLGLFEPVDMELPENAAPLLPDPWREINTMTISYGHGIAVTPLHLVRAIASLVGDGRLLPITFMKGGNVNKPEGETIIGQTNVINVRKLLRLVVEYGSATKANALGYRVGGKTGTAEKLGAGSGRYKADSRLASFVGAFPIEDPRYVVLAMIDEPQGNKSTFGYATGGWVAAPVVSRVVERMGPMLGIRPIYEIPADKDDDRWVYYDERRPHAISF